MKDDGCSNAMHLPNIPPMAALHQKCNGWCHTSKTLQKQYTCIAILPNLTIFNGDNWIWYPVSGIAPLQKLQRQTSPSNALGTVSYACPLATVVYTLSQSVDAHCAIRHICPLHFVRMLLYKNGSVKLQRTVQCSEVLGTYDYTATVKLPTLSSVSLMCGV